LEIAFYFATLRQWADKPQESFLKRLEACRGKCEYILALGKLQYAHCDLNLDNFVIDVSQKVRLVDFG
jgi:Ser/Thr protein kinase RdoA (MazF antagonist)